MNPGALEVNHPVSVMGCANSTPAEPAASKESTGGGAVSARASAQKPEASQKSARASAAEKSVSKRKSKRKSSKKMSKEHMTVQKSLSAALDKRASAEELRDKGILKTEMQSTASHLEMEMAKQMVNRKLSSRMSPERLKDKGVLEELPEGYVPKPSFWEAGSLWLSGMLNIGAEEEPKEEKKEETTGEEKV